MESFLTWWIFHNSQIIQWLIAIIVLLSVLWIGVSFFSRPGSEKVSFDNTGLKDQLNSFESNLKSLLQEARATGPKDTNSGPPDQNDSSIGADQARELQKIKTDFLTLKSELEAKQTEIDRLKSESLKKASENPVSLEASGPDPMQLARIRELEAKLKEYEIIEEDIADLSFYKEENKKLRAKLAESGESNREIPSGPPAPVPEPEPGLGSMFSEPPPAAVAGGDLFSEFSADLNEDIVKQFSESVSPAGGSNDVNLDAMLSDMEKLGGFGEGDHSSGLEEDLDVEKMAAEAGDLHDKKS